MSFGDLTKMSDAVAEEGFRVRSQQIRLRETIETLIEKVRGEKNRVVFFLDDLDRCLPKTMLRVLEALKLYLNVEDCVYFLGLDHTVVKKGIEKEYAELAIEDRDYLDKIVQIPFLIPPIHADRAREFIEGLLPEEAKQWAEKLVPFVGSNPRQVKRFTNNLALNLLLASELFEDEEHDLDVNVVVVLLLIQHENEALAGQISRNWRLFPELMTKGEEAERLLQDYFGGEKRLQELVQALDCPDDTPFERYVHLTTVAGAAVRREERAAFEPELAGLDPGSFKMGSEEGSDDEKPVRDVTIGYRFAMGRYPVTFEEYDRFAESTGRDRPGDAGWGRGRRPVINVSWNDGKAYAVWLADETGKGYRLPTEAEWEYACRAGTETAYSCGDEIGEKDANFGKTKGKTTKVGSYLANPWRLFDMHGNVWEWVEDVWHDSYEGAPADGNAWTEAGNEDGRVLRGGSWVNRQRFLRSALRN